MIEEMWGGSKFDLKGKIEVSCFFTKQHYTKIYRFNSFLDNKC
jgi:hypothetical protein